VLGIASAMANLSGIQPQQPHNTVGWPMRSIAQQSPHRIITRFCWASLGDDQPTRQPTTTAPNTVGWPMRSIAQQQPSSHRRTHFCWASLRRWPTYAAANHNSHQHRRLANAKHCPTITRITPTDTFFVGHRLSDDQPTRRPTTTAKKHRRLANAQHCPTNTHITPTDTFLLGIASAMTNLRDDQPQQPQTP